MRIICATNKNLLQEVEQVAFRQDLYYRLNVISITIPPLRNRVKDIPALFRHFLDLIGRDRGGKFRVEPEVMTALQRYAWPGNVRELQNVVERAVSLSEDGVITPAHLPVEIYGLPDTAPLQLFPRGRFAGLGREQRRQMAGETERQRILLLLSSSGGNVSMVARELGVSRNTLYRKMRQYAIEN